MKVCSLFFARPRSDNKAPSRGFQSAQPVAHIPPLTDPVPRNNSGRSATSVAKPTRFHPASDGDSGRKGQRRDPKRGYPIRVR